MRLITDEFVLSKDTLTTHEAADYLKISWWDLTEGLKKGKYKFGTATCNPGGKYTYTIYAKQVYKFKQGITEVDQQQYADLIKKFDEAIGIMQNCVQLMSVFILKQENALTYLISKIKSKSNDKEN